MLIAVKHLLKTQYKIHSAIALTVWLMSIVLYCLFTSSSHCALFCVFMIVLHPTCLAPACDLSSVRSPWEEGCVFLAYSLSAGDTQMTALPDSCSQGRVKYSAGEWSCVREQNSLLYLYVSQEIQNEREKVW